MRWVRAWRCGWLIKQAAPWKPGLSFSPSLWKLRLETACGEAPLLHPSKVPRPAIGPTGTDLAHGKRRGARKSRMRAPGARTRGCCLTPVRVERGAGARRAERRQPPRAPTRLRSSGSSSLRVRGRPPPTTSPFARCAGCSPALRMGAGCSSPAPSPPGVAPCIPAPIAPVEPAGTPPPRAGSMRLLGLPAPTDDAHDAPQDRSLIRLLHAVEGNAIAQMKKILEDGVDLGRRLPGKEVQDAFLLRALEQHEEGGAAAAEAAGGPERREQAEQVPAAPRRAERPQARRRRIARGGRRPAAAGRGRIDGRLPVRRRGRNSHIEIDLLLVGVRPGAALRRGSQALDWRRREGGGEDCDVPHL